ncbi:MAG: hypothetical protein AAF799_37405 [Myxococcota bacterium]
MDTKTKTNDYILRSIAGLAICALAPGCDRQTTEHDHHTRSDCAPASDQMSTVFVSSAVFDEIEAWADDDGAPRLKHDLNAAAATDWQSADGSCDDLSDYPGVSTAQCASSKDLLHQLLVKQAAKDAGSQCVVVAGIGPDQNVDVLPDFGDEEVSENTEGDTTKRISRHGPASSILLTAMSRDRANGSHSGDPVSIDTKKAVTRIKVMNVCYDDEHNRIKDGPSLRVSMEAEFHGKITVVNQSTKDGKRGNSVGKGEFIAGTHRYTLTDNWTLINGTHPQNLALSRVVSHSSWSVNWSAVVPFLIDIATWAADYFFPEYESLPGNWKKESTGEESSAPNPKSAGEYDKKTLDDFRKIFVVVGEDGGENGRDSKQDQNRVNDSIVIEPFSPATYEMASGVQASVDTHRYDHDGHYRNFVSVAMASDFGVLFTMNYPESECQKLDGAARAACERFNPVGFYAVGAKTEKNIGSSMSDFYNNDTEREGFKDGTCGPDEGRECLPDYMGGCIWVGPPCINYQQKIEDVYSPRDFDALAENARVVAGNMGWDDNEPGLKNTPVQDMVDKIKDANDQGVTIVTGIMELEK